jgi:hypothetical protein
MWLQQRMGMHRHDLTFRQLEKVIENQMLILVDPRKAYDSVPCELH